MSRVLVTGGAGAIGSGAVRRLQAEGHDVVVIDDLSSGRRSLIPDGIPFVEGSVARDSDLDRAFAGNPEYVLHLAALFANQNSVEHPDRDLEVNGVGTLKVLDLAHRRGVKKVLFTSSSCVYGQKAVMDEADEVFQPDTPYAITKLLGEQYCRFWSRHHHLDVVILRLFNTYGPGEFPGRYRNVIPNFFKLAAGGKPLTITGTGEETRDFNFVDDCVTALIGALFGATRSGDAFNVASGRETRIIDLARMINEIAGSAAEIQFIPQRDWDRVTTRRGSIDRARDAFGYSPSVDLRTGLERTYDWLRKHA